MKTFLYTLMRLVTIPLLPLLLVIGNAFSQDVRQSNTWQASRVKNPTSGLSKANDSKFISGNSEFRWTQKGTKTYQFSLDEVVGTWNDLRADGQLEFKLKLDGRPGTALVSGVNGKYTIGSRYQRPSGGKELNIEFLIDHVEAR